jgi:hypothetical protein
MRRSPVNGIAAGREAARYNRNEPKGSLPVRENSNFRKEIMMRRKASVVLLISMLLASSAAWSQTFQTLLQLNPNKGAFPLMGVIPDSSGNLYGAGYGGPLFEVTNSGGTWIENDLFNFVPPSYNLLTGSPSSQGLLIRDAEGNIFGDAATGGRWNFGRVGASGVIYQLNPNGVLTTLYEFTGGADGGAPYGGLIADAQGNFYGSAAAGGNFGGTCPSQGQNIGCGVVFELVKGTHTWTYKVLYSFQGNGTDGFNPQSPLTFDSQGNLYGTTVQGGYFGGGGECQNNGCGTVFKLTKPVQGSNQWTESILYQFTGSTDGAFPLDGLVFDGQGNLYSDTNGGGAQGFGNIYQLAPSGSGYTLNTIFSFNGQNGADPSGVQGGNKLLLDSAGSIWGVAYSGGANGYGTVIKLSAGTWNVTDIHDFTNGTDGNNPQCTLTQDSAGNIFGTTSGNSYYGTPPGTVFKITPALDQQTNR